MSRVSKIAFIILVLLSATMVLASYKPTNLDTKAPPAAMVYDIEQPEEAELIFENDTYRYYFKDDRDILYLYDKRNQYTWKSGLDIAPAKLVKKALRADEPLGYEPLEVKMNETFTAIANSLIVVEYYDDSNNIKRLASASDEASSKLMTVEGEEGHFILDIAYEEKDLQVKAHLFLTDNGYDLKIQYDDISGGDKPLIAAIMLNPFMGASGGQYQLYDPEAGKHGDKIPKPELPGYVFVPDGSGALIRFNDYNVSLKSYESKIYGPNLSKDTYSNLFEINSYVPLKSPLMPVYGIAHGNEQAAFVGYAREGDEHMSVIVVPEENTTLYTWAYPRFVYNNLYHQIFNKRGDGFFTLFDEPDAFDIHFSYEFLAGSGETGHSADYVGMALTYRDHLMDTDVLSKSELVTEDIPLRLDFIMSDQKKSVIGYENAVTTNANQVSDILDSVTDLGIDNINVGLLGWQDGGRTTAKPWKMDFSGDIGSKSDFRDLMENAQDKGVDLSFVTDYVNIHEDQMGLVGNATKHINGWYLNRTLWTDVPFTEFAYARPDKSAEWLIKQSGAIADFGLTSHTIDGMSNRLISDHGNKPITEEEMILLYQETLDEVSGSMTLNMDRPNEYLWAYTDRFLNAPVYPTQYIIETDTVPFLQLVLSGTMEVYAPYSNFSFYNDSDILRMIDYNIFPSFVLSDGASYLLASTNSLDFYSTEYSLYEPLIENVYNKVNTALSAVMNKDWIDRDVLGPGVIKNTYEGNQVIIINYTDETFTYNGMDVEPLSYEVMKEVE